MVECARKGCLAPDRRDDGAEDRRHREQRGQAVAEVDAAKGGKRRQDDGPYAEAKQHLARAELARKLLKLVQDSETPWSDCRRLRGSYRSATARSSPTCSGPLWGRWSCSPVPLFFAL